MSSSIYIQIQPNYLILTIILSFSVIRFNNASSRISASFNLFSMSSPFNLMLLKHTSNISSKTKIEIKRKNPFYRSELQTINILHNNNQHPSNLHFIFDSILHFCNFVSLLLVVIATKKSQLVLSSNHYHKHF